LRSQSSLIKSSSGPEDRFMAEEVEGYKVIPLEEAVEFCRRNVYSYEPALEMLDEMYGLGLEVKYREASGE